MQRYAAICCLIFAAAQLGAASSRVSAQVSPERPTELKRLPQSSESRPDRALTETDIRAILEILEAQRMGDIDRISSAMRTAKFDVTQFERRLARVIYAVIDATMQQAELHFRDSKESTFSDAVLGVIIQRNQLPDWRERLNQQVEAEYQSAGSTERFRKDQAVVLKHQVAVARQLWPLYQLSREKTADD